MRTSKKINPDSLEKTSCLLCHNEQQRIVNDFPPYMVVCCRSCGLYYLSPRLTERAILQSYKKGYFEHNEDGYLNYAEQKPALKATFRRFLKNLKKNNCTGGSLLEIGCGYGYLLEEAAQFFDTRVGTDLSQEAVSKATQKADKIYLGGIEQLSPEEEFNCIIANQVIEHIYNPIVFVKRLLNHLKPNGSLILSTPDISSFWKILMKNNWPSFKMPEHVCFYDKKSLITLMRKSGLINTAYIAYPHAFPLELILSKFKLKLPFKIKQHLWLPATTIALCGRRATQ